MHYIFKFNQLLNKSVILVGGRLKFMCIMRKTILENGQETKVVRLNVSIDMTLDRTTRKSKPLKFLVGFHPYPTPTCSG